MLRGGADALFIENRFSTAQRLTWNNALRPDKRRMAAPMRWCGVMLALKRRLPELRPYSVR